MKDGGICQYLHLSYLTGIDSGGKHIYYSTEMTPQSPLTKLQECRMIFKAKKPMNAYLKILLLTLTRAGDGAAYMVKYLPIDCDLLGWRNLTNITVLPCDSVG
ncbi:hypothetical protein E2C01_065724 [Portunus trituberculatus]|uniref:Uncharacterized protein n=1 Tax=Portunus trituberculatus TaxID=210409 RepID=A0A5B7HQD3_PORTR|nr:hypothetical protein [Portunus trituberculatus]